MKPNKKQGLTRADMTIIYLCETILDIPIMCTTAVIILIGLYSLDLIAVELCAKITFWIMVVFIIHGWRHRNDRCKRNN
jgi:hypothetical protein